MSRELRVGLLVLAGLFLFLIGLFAIANRSFLLSDTFYVRARFGSVAGLQSGAVVTYQGVNVGRVETVTLPERPGEKITVTLAIRDRARHLVRENTQAQIKTDGLVGNQIVVLVNPVAEGVANPVDEGDFITGVDPFDLFEITDNMLSTVDRFDAAAETFHQIMVDVQNGEGTLGKIIYDPSLYNEFVATTGETRRVLNSLADNAVTLVNLGEQATAGVNSILYKIDEGEGTLAMFLNDPGVYQRILSTSDTLQAISRDLRSITSSADNAANWGALGAFRFAELMEAAKHNWLFRRYFEERGYMERAPFEQRERALNETYELLEAQRRHLYDWERELERREAAVEINGGRPVTPVGLDESTLPLPADTTASTR
jgi:phospholipid/cholesterol/gamma-HCH transport system substrate-binding protein